MTCNKILKASYLANQIYSVEMVKFENWIAKFQSFTHSHSHYMRLGARCKNISVNGYVTNNNDGSYGESEVKSSSGYKSLA